MTDVKGAGETEGGENTLESFCGEQDGNKMLLLRRRTIKTTQLDSHPRWLEAEL